MQIRNSTKKIAIVGGGVIGLTCSLVLSSEYDLTIIADKIGVKSDSWKATAIWHVYLVPETEEILGWAQYTLKKLCDLSITEKNAGVELIKGVELFRNGLSIIPSWSHIPPLFKILSADEVATYNDYSKLDLTQNEVSELKQKPVLWGYHIETPTSDMFKYLDWLESKVLINGVKIIHKRIDNLNQLVNDFDLIINCSGFGARELVQDTDYEVYKGQYFVIKAGNFSPKTYIGDDDHPKGMAYMIPRFGEVMIGGCAEKNVEDLELTLAFDDTIRRAGLYSHWLKQCSPIEQAREPVVGIRPCRTSGVRLELDKISASVPIIHNYGHGGSGYSLAWGCAEAVKSIIKKLENES